jgi:glutamate 5-kinase
MNEKLKQPNSLFDAEALASHISIVTSKSNDNRHGKSGSNSSKGGMKSKVRSSNKIEASRNESEVSSSVSGSMSKTQTN